MLLFFFHPRVRKIKNEVSSCPGIFSRTLRYGCAASGGALAQELAARHRGWTRVSTDVSSLFRRFHRFFLRSDISHPIFLRSTSFFYFF